MGCHLTDTRPVASRGKGLVLHLWYLAASSVWKLLLYVISLSTLQEIKMRTLSYFFLFSFSVLRQVMPQNSLSKKESD